MRFPENTGLSQSCKTVKLSKPCKTMFFVEILNLTSQWLNLQKTLKLLKAKTLF